MTDLLKSERYIKEHRDETVETMCRFAATDMLLFWNREENINTLQQKTWQPFLDVLQRENNVTINISDSLQVPENEVLLKVLKNKLLNLNDKELTAAFLAAMQLKSVILGLSLLNKKISVEKMFKAAFLEELYQNKLWGTDKEAEEKRKSVKSELKKIKEYLNNG